MVEFSPFEVEEKIKKIGKEALLNEIPTYNGPAQNFYYQAILEIEARELEKYKVKLQEDANSIAAGANRKSGWAIAISIFACAVSAAATIYAATLK